MIYNEIMAYLKYAQQHEGKISYMYLCTAGKITTGIGCVLHSTADAMMLKWMDASGNRVTKDIVRKTYLLLSRMPNGKKHTYYIKKMPKECQIFIDDEEIYKLAIDKIKKNYLPTLVQEFSDFESYPIDAKIALLDIVYAVGTGAFNRGWHKLKCYCSMHDFGLASNEVKISSQRPKFNKMRKQMMMDAAKC